MSPELDGCELDFTKEPMPDDELEDLLVLPARRTTMRDTGIADRLRKAGLDVREVTGWKTRGREDFHPEGSINHHTAGPPDKPGARTPSLKTVIFGRPDLSGPLCNVYMGYDDVFYVVAAGVANHAGEADNGDWRGMRFNADVYGLEVEHPGTFVVPAARVRLMARCHAALIWRPEGASLPARNVGQHAEWAPSRKIDFATNFKTKLQRDAFRSLVKAELERLKPVDQWTVSFLNQNNQRVTEVSASPSRWDREHPGALQRGQVRHTPKR